MGINIIWALCSYYGFKCIRSKNTRYFLELRRNIRIFGYTVVLNLLLRIAMYAISGVIMQGKVPSYANITKEELNSNHHTRQISYARRCIPRDCIS